ncbi:MAG: hypothetical protein HY963_06765 [Ignavibacteriales bacterium]|nr:hypothetical protein [Ignavibacteriales bacterium]
MKILPTSFNRSNLKTTTIFLAISIVFIVMAFVIGINDNPPGLLLLFLGSITLLLAFIHHWKESKKFKRLTFASIIGFIVFVILHNLFDGLSQMFSAKSLLQILINGLGVAFFLFAIFLCPAGLIVGAWGWISKGK